MRKCKNCKGTGQSHGRKPPKLNKKTHDYIGRCIYCKGIGQRK